MRVLWAVHDGQNIPFDRNIAIREQVVAGQQTNVTRAEAERQRFLGLVGGYSAYDHCVSARIFPLQLASGWTNWIIPLQAPASSNRSTPYHPVTTIPQTPQEFTNSDISCK